MEQDLLEQGFDTDKDGWRPNDPEIEVYAPGSNSRKNLLAQLRRGRSTIPVGFRPDLRHRRRAKPDSCTQALGWTSCGGERTTGKVSRQSLAHAVGTDGAVSKANADDVPQPPRDSAELEAEGQPTSTVACMCLPRSAGHKIVGEESQRIEQGHGR